MSASARPVWTVAVLALLLLAACDDPPPPPAPPAPPRPGGPAALGPEGDDPGQLVRALFSPNQRVRKTARDRLLALRQEALPHLIRGLEDRAMPLAATGEILAVIVELGHRHLAVAEHLERWLAQAFPAAKLADLERPENADHAKIFAQLMVGMIQLGQQRRVPAPLRVYYFSRVIEDLAPRADSASLIEAACELLAIGPPAIPAIVARLDHPEPEVARRFIALAFYLHRRQTVAAIMARLDAGPPRSMSIYAALNHLTARDLWLEDIGARRPPDSTTAEALAALHARWHAQMRARWRAWWKRAGAEGPEAWWRAGLKAAGVTVGRLDDRASVPALIGALAHRSRVIRCCALAALRRLTFHQLAEVRYADVWEIDPVRLLPPDAQTTRLTEADLLKHLQSHWRAWWAEHGKRGRAAWAQLESARAVAWLVPLADPRISLPDRVHALVAADFFVRWLLRLGEVDPLPDEIVWEQEPHHHIRRRTRVIPALRAAVEALFADAEATRRVGTAPWAF